MIRTFLPAILGLVAIVAISAYEGLEIKDRWVEPGAEAKELAKRFEQVPKTLGNGAWVGEDMPVDEVTRKTAGAIGYVSRRYTHATTGRSVVLWLIVGHSRDVTRHTPNICYPSSGYRQSGSQNSYTIDSKEGKAADFYTSKFEKENTEGHSIERVFWTFNHPEYNLWEAPEKARFHYGLQRALYKLYFTSQVRSDEDAIADNVAIEFAELMLPEIDKALFPTDGATVESSESEVEE